MQHIIPTAYHFDKVSIANQDASTMDGVSIYRQQNMQSSVVSLFPFIKVTVSYGTSMVYWETPYPAVA